MFFLSYQESSGIPGQGNTGVVMEAALHSRDRIGVQDFVLLEDYMNVDAFIDNLLKRYQENLIYVSLFAFVTY